MDKSAKKGQRGSLDVGPPAETAWSFHFEKTFGRGGKNGGHDFVKGPFPESPSLAGRPSLLHAGFQGVVVEPESLRGPGQTVLPGGFHRPGPEPLGNPGAGPLLPPPCLEITAHTGKRRGKG